LQSQEWFTNYLLTTTTFIIISTSAAIVVSFPLNACGIVPLTFDLAFFALGLGGEDGACHAVCLKNLSTSSVLRSLNTL
jgi:hypothetical protein